jgi:hypothetical protein
MGLRLIYVEFILEAIEKARLKDVKQLKMVELGSQEMRNTPGFLENNKKLGWKDFPSGKEFFSQNFGFDHTSIDLDGQRGALKIDLNKELPSDMKEKFDVLTDSGTSEHVSNQYMNFKNIHSLVKVGGVIAHINPKTGCWKGHSNNFYTEEFHQELARLCGYKVIEITSKEEPVMGNIYASYIKTDHPFVSEDQFPKHHIKRK